MHCIALHHYALLHLLGVGGALASSVAHYVMGEEQVKYAGPPYKAFNAVRTERGAPRKSEGAAQVPHEKKPADLVCHFSPVTAVIHVLLWFRSFCHPASYFTEMSEQLFTEIDVIRDHRGGV